MARGRVKTPIAEYQPITVRFPADILIDVRDVAFEEDRSANEQVVRIVKQWLAARKKRKDDGFLTELGAAANSTH